MFIVIGILIKVLFFTSTTITGGNITTNLQIIFGGVIVMAIASILYYLYNYLSSTYLSIIGNIFMILFLMGLTVALAMFFIIFNNTLKLSTGWSGFFVYFIFYIPCLLINLIEYLKSEFKVTTNTVFILFILEICFILCYFYLPKIINMYLSKGGIPLLEGNRFLDKEYILTTGRTLKIKDEKSDEIYGDKNSKISDQNFSISMWVYVNAQPPSDGAYTKESNIFIYGNDSSNTISRKPQIVYNYDANNNNVNKFKIYFTDTIGDDVNLKNYYNFSMPEQKWNNIVVNYNSNIVDLFINGILETSFAFAPNFNLPNYNDGDIIKIGSNDGLYGSICNIRYYQDVLTKSEIINKYNSLVLKNPPINTI